MKKSVLLSLALLASLSLAACSAHPSSSSSHRSAGQVTESNAAKKPKIKVTTDIGATTKVGVKSKDSYVGNVSNSSWQGNVFKINEVKMVTTDPFTYHDDKDGIYHAKGLVFIKYSIKAVAFNINDSTDISRLITNLGNETNIDSLDSQDANTVKKGATKTGVMVFPLIDNPSSIKLLHLKVTLLPKDVDNYDDKDYNFDLVLPK